MLEYLLAMEVTARWDGGYRCSAQARQFELTVDEPERHGGTDTGMQPSEVLLASVASCFTLAVAHVAMKRGLAVDGFTVTAQGEHRGARFRRIVVRVDHADPTPELFDVVRRAVSVCTCPTPSGEGRRWSTWSARCLSIGRLPRLEEQLRLRLPESVGSRPDPQPPAVGL